MFPQRRMGVFPHWGIVPSGRAFTRRKIRSNWRTGRQKKIGTVTPAPSIAQSGGVPKPKRLASHDNARRRRRSAGHWRVGKAADGWQGTADGVGLGTKGLFGSVKMAPGRAAKSLSLRRHNSGWGGSWIFVQRNCLPNQMPKNTSHVLHHCVKNGV